MFFSSCALHKTAHGRARSTRIPPLRARSAPNRQAPSLHLPIANAARARRAPRVLHATDAPHDLRARHTARRDARLPARAGRQAGRGRPRVEGAAVPARGGCGAGGAGARDGAGGPEGALGEHVGADG